MVAPEKLSVKNMLQEIQTERLKLKPWTRHDLPALQQLFDDVEVRRYLFDDTPVSLGRSRSSKCIWHCRKQEASVTGLSF